MHPASSDNDRLIPESPSETRPEPAAADDVPVKDPVGKKPTVRAELMTPLNIDVLRQNAYKMSEKELHYACYREKLADAWYVVHHGMLQRSAYRLLQILISERELNHSSVFICHETQLGKDNPVWIELDIQSSLSIEERTLFIKALFGFRVSVRHQLMALAGYLLIINLIYYQKNVFPSFREIEKSLMDKMESTRELRSSRNVDNTPALKAVIAKTRFQILITNSGTAAWGTLQIKLRLKSGEVAEFSEKSLVSSNSTAVIPLKNFKMNGIEFSGKSDDIKGIRVEVAGYKSFEKSF